MYILCMRSLTTIQWLKDDFLEYINGWESSVHHLKDKRKMQLSAETVEGLRMTGKAIEHNKRV